MNKVMNEYCATVANQHTNEQEEIMVSAASVKMAAKLAKQMIADRPYMYVACLWNDEGDVVWDECFEENYQKEMASVVNVGC